MKHARRLLVALLVVSLALQTACRESKPPSTGTLIVREGTATVTVAGQPPVGVAASKTAEVPIGAVVRTAAGGRAVVRWGEQLHSLEPDSELRFDAPSADGGDKGVSKVELLRGLATFFLPKGEAAKTYKFQAGCGTIVAAVKGTIFRLDGRTRDVGVEVLRGTIALFNKEATDGAPLAEVTPEARALAPAGGDVVKVPVKAADVEAQLFLLKVLIEENNKTLDTF